MARASAARINKVRAANHRAQILSTLTGAGLPADFASRLASSGSAEQFANSGALTASAAVFKGSMPRNTKLDRHTIAQRWQEECYRHVNICGEARYAATLFSAMAGRAEIGVSEPQTLARKAVWVESGPEVEAFADIAPTVRDRTRLIRAFMLHWIIAGECYLIARERVATDPPGPNPMIWEIVAVTELRKRGNIWSVRHDNENYIDLHPNDPVIRMWNPDPENRREAWSPFRALLPTLREIEWLTRHIFTQVRSRLLGAGVWFLPDNLTFAPPPPDAVEGGQEAIDAMNEAEKFMMSMANSSMEMLESDEVGFPSVVMADAAALVNIDQNKLIQFWSEIDKAAMELRSDAVRRFALGCDMPPEQILGSSGLAVTGAGGSAGSVNHWGVWANEEQTISAHVSPALDEFTGAVTTGYLWLVCEGTDKVIAYDPANIRMKQDRSEEAMAWYDRGELSARVGLRETGFDPDHDAMTDEEFARWLLKRYTGSNATPEMMVEATKLLGVAFPALAQASAKAGGPPPGAEAPNTDALPNRGRPKEQHDHTPAPFALAASARYGARLASAEGLVLRALEKAGNRLISSGKRGKDRPVGVDPVTAHCLTGENRLYTPGDPVNFDFTLAATVFQDMEPEQIGLVTRQMATYCAHLYETGATYSRAGLTEALGGLR